MTLSSTYWGLDNHFFIILFLYRRHIDLFFNLQLSTMGFQLDLCFFFFFSLDNFSRSQYLCWCITGKTFLIFSPQFKVHKSSSHFTIAKRCSPIDQGKYKDLIFVIGERTQQYQRFVFILDYYIKICQIREKFCADVNMIINGGSSLQLKTVKSPLQMQAVLDTLRQVLARENLLNLLRRSLIHPIIF